MASSSRWWEMEKRRMMKGKVKASNRKKAKNVFQETSLKLTLLVSRQMEKGSKPVNLTRLRMTEKIVLTIHGVSFPSTSFMLLLDVGEILTSILGWFDRDSSNVVLTPCKWALGGWPSIGRLHSVNFNSLSSVLCSHILLAEGVCAIALLATRYLNSLNLIIPFHFSSLPCVLLKVCLLLLYCHLNVWFHLTWFVFIQQQFALCFVQLWLGLLKVCYINKDDHIYRFEAKVLK